MVYDKDLLYYKKLSKYAIIPTQASPESAGYDLYSAYDYTILGNDNQVISTDLILLPPVGTYCRIAGRSGLASNYNLTIGGGVVDRDYQGNVRVIMFNHDSKPYKISAGERIAQIITEKIVNPKLVELSEYKTTERHDKGFGSSGK
jgi:dUTP pyrophosphatase